VGKVAFSLVTASKAATKPRWERMEEAIPSERESVSLKPSPTGEGRGAVPPNSESHFVAGAEREWGRMRVTSARETRVTTIQEGATDETLHVLGPLLGQANGWRGMRTPAVTGVEKPYHSRNAFGGDGDADQGRKRRYAATRVPACFIRLHLHAEGPVALTSIAFSNSRE